MIDVAGGVPAVGSRKTGTSGAGGGRFCGTGDDARAMSEPPNAMHDPPTAADSNPGICKRRFGSGLREMRARIDTVVSDMLVVAGRADVSA